MTDSNQDDCFDGWEPCPPGALADSALADGAAQHRRMFLIKVAVGSFLGVAGFRAYLDSCNLNHDFHYNVLSCIDVKANLAGYIRQQLDAGLVGKIERHLEQCAGCLLAYRIELDEMIHTNEVSKSSFPPARERFV